MPALPSTPPSAPTAPSTPTLPSPLALLVVFVVTFAVVTGIYALYPVVASWLAARRARASDEESACGGSIAKKARKASAPAPAEVLFAARTAIFVLKAKLANEKDLVAFHKSLMARKTAPKASQRVEAGSSVVSRFIKKHSAASNKGHAGARRKRSLPGPSPLRSVYTAPEPAPAPEPTPAITTPALPTTPILPSAPASPTIPKGQTALILAALARGDDSDTASVNYEEEEGIAPSITFDAIRGIWTAKAPAPAPSGEPKPDAHTEETDIEAILARFPAPPPIYAPVLVDKRLRALWREGKEKKKQVGAGVGESLKKSPRRSRIAREKENVCAA
ncbi:hypothetical protein C8R45DRAFT_1207021 [Mycena sanguinolenta]|nr:hypothetical protein C8R45DRAFT_1207021 [Mycena sanguinolenta]